MHYDCYKKTSELSPLVISGQKLSLKNKCDFSPLVPGGHENVINT